MKRQIQHSDSISMQKRNMEIQEPVDFKFHYQFNDVQNSDKYSPTSTCPTEGNLRKWLDDYPQCQEIAIQLEKRQEYQHIQKTIQENHNILSISVKIYSDIVIKYLKERNYQESTKNIDFSSCQEFQDLVVEKLQYSTMIKKYNDQSKFNQKTPESFEEQHSIFKSFIQKITYFCYEQINFQLLYLITVMYKFKRACFAQLQTRPSSQQSLLQSLISSPMLHFISFSFSDKPTNPNSLLKFLQQLFNIISQLYKFENSIINQSIVQECIVSQLKMFSSQIDLWDDQEEDSSYSMNRRSRQFD